jgi:23S rRNA pseudouridine1911/1915/1917 synthase
LVLPPHSFGIIDETADWIVVDKPPFLQVHPSKPSDEATLWHHLRELLAFELANGGQISLVNRLDRETSGVVLVAKTAAAARQMGLRMLRQEFRKEYTAIVWGWPARDAWDVNAPIIRQGERIPSAIYLKRTVHPDGAPAQTRFRVLERCTRGGDKFSLIQAEPLTGRTHQLRVHLAHAGFPVVGDKIYGPDERCYLEFIQTGWTASLEAKLLLNRHALHATALKMGDHEWRAALPPDMREFIHPT